MAKPKPHDAFCRLDAKLINVGNLLTQSGSPMSQGDGDEVDPFDALSTLPKTTANPAARRTAFRRDPRGTLHHRRRPKARLTQCRRPHIRQKLSVSNCPGKCRSSGPQVWVTGSRGGKLRASVCIVLTPSRARYLRSQNVQPGDRNRNGLC